MQSRRGPHGANVASIAGNASNDAMIATCETGKGIEPERRAPSQFQDQHFVIRMLLAIPAPRQSRGAGPAEVMPAPRGASGGGGDYVATRP